jgi:hypothetical protein
MTIRTICSGSALRMVVYDAWRLNSNRAREFGSSMPSDREAGLELSVQRVWMANWFPL